jgi:hypothetical protein
MDQPRLIHQGAARNRRQRIFCRTDALPPQSWGCRGGFLLLRSRYWLLRVIASKGRHRHPPMDISTCRHAIALSRHIPPEFCALFAPSTKRAQGRPGAGWHPRSAARSVAQKDRTAAYRCRRTHGLPCAVVGRLMPCSPRRRIPFASVASRNSPTPRRLTPVPPPQDLAVATTARTTRFCRTQAIPASPQGASQDKAPFVQRGLQVAHGARLNPLPRPATHIRDGAARVHRSPIRGS